MPPWTGPPQGTIPGIVALELLLARTETIAVCLPRINAYPTGVEIELVMMSDEESGTLDRLMFGAAHRFHRSAGQAEQGIPDDMLRFGMQFADGSKATNIDTSHAPPPSREPVAPVMHARGGGGGGGHWRQNIWVWPLPPAGTLTLVCEWPAASIPLTRHDIDTQVIRDAATRAQVIFTDEHLPEPPGRGGTTTAEGHRYRAG